MIDCNQGRKEEWQHHYFLFFYLLEPGIHETGSVTTTGYWVPLIMVAGGIHI